MRTFTCPACAFSFNEADKFWDDVIESGRCPRCSEPVQGFPVAVKLRPSSLFPLSTGMAKRIVYFVLATLAVVFAQVLFINGVVGILAAENWASAAVAFGLGWVLNNKTGREALAQKPYLALCAVYITLASILKVVLHPSAEVSDRSFLLLGVEIVIAYLLSWIAINMIKKEPTAGTNACSDSKILAASKAMPAAQTTIDLTVPPSVEPEFMKQSVQDLEDRLYERIAQELEANAVDKGIWTKAFAQAGGDDKQTRVLYIKVRFAQLREMEGA